MMTGGRGLQSVVKDMNGGDCVKEFGGKSNATCQVFAAAHACLNLIGGAVL